MSAEMDKYWVIEAGSTLIANEKIAKFEKQGYKLMDVKPHQGIGGTCFIITMYLSGTPDLGNYMGFENIDIGSPRQHEVEQLGYKALSPYSKHITWAKPKTPQPRLTMIREALTQIYQIAEDNDEKDTTIMDQVYRLADKALVELEGGV